MSGPTPSPEHVRVFISYSHDSVEHMDRVLALSNKLRSHGIESIVDRYFEDTLDMRWTDWMNEQIEAATFVLVVATPKYQARLKPGGTGTPGNGAYWEGALITQYLYEEHGRNKRFVPVYFTPEDMESIPLHLKGFTHYNVGTDKGYGDLYRKLTRQPGVVPPPVGTVVHPNQLYSKQEPPPTPSPRGNAVRERIEQLARAYQDLRKSMLPGDMRTRKMEVIAAKMRSLACDAYFMLDYLAKNPEPGARLAAVSLLQVKPNPEYLEWLAERLAPEKPFVGYHAAVALLVAARTMEQEYANRVRAAIEMARHLLGTGLGTTDRGKVLEAALNELDESGVVTREFLLQDRPLPS